MTPTASTHRPRIFSSRGYQTLAIEYRPEARAAVETAALDAIRKGTDAVIDLDSRPELDTEDFQFLIRLLRRCRDIGGDLALRTTKPQHRRILQVTGLDNVFPIAFPAGV
jgi:anti-anti-sigma factor